MSRTSRIRKKNAKRGQSTIKKSALEQIGRLCIQGYPNRICCGCTTGCIEPVFAYPIREID